MVTSILPHPSSRRRRHTQPREGPSHVKGSSHRLSTVDDLEETCARSRRTSTSARAAQVNRKYKGPDGLMMDRAAPGVGRADQSTECSCISSPRHRFRLRNPRSVARGQGGWRTPNAETLRHQVFGRGTADYYAQLRTQHVTPAWIRRRHQHRAPEQGRATRVALARSASPGDAGSRARRNRAAERRVLRLTNPELPGLSASNTLVANLQIVMPGEIARPIAILLGAAPDHRGQGRLHGRKR